MITYKSRNPYRNEEVGVETEIMPISPNIGEDLAATDKSNDIFLYETINEQVVLKIRKKIDKKIIEFKKFSIENDMNSIDNTFHINLHINSYGGTVSDSFNLHDYIKGSPIPIYTYIEGVVASAATIISVAGKKRFMTPNSMLMIHQLSSWFGGKYEEFNDEKSNLDLIMKMIKNIYVSNTNLKTQKLNQLLKRDIYLGVDKCLEYGFVDEITI